MDDASRLNVEARRRLRQHVVNMRVAAQMVKAEMPTSPIQVGIMSGDERDVTTADGFVDAARYLAAYFDHAPFEADLVRVLGHTSFEDLEERLRNDALD